MYMYIYIHKFIDIFILSCITIYICMFIRIITRTYAGSRLRNEKPKIVGNRNCLIELNRQCNVLTVGIRILHLQFTTNVPIHNFL